MYYVSNQGLGSVHEKSYVSTRSPCINQAGPTFVYPKQVPGRSSLERGSKCESQCFHWDLLSPKRECFNEEGSFQGVFLPCRYRRGFFVDGGSKCTSSMCSRIRRVAFVMWGRPTICSVALPDTINQILQGFVSQEHTGIWVLVYSESYATRAEAMLRERLLKSGTGRQWLKDHLLKSSASTSD
jgi:hypothetical protein